MRMFLPAPSRALPVPHASPAGMLLLGLAAAATPWPLTPAAAGAPAGGAQVAGAFAQPARADAADREALLIGVNSIARPGVPGPIAITGRGARAVIAAELDKGVLAAVVAAGDFADGGRVVAFGHTGYLDVSQLKAADTARLLENAVHWAAAPARAQGQPGGGAPPARRVRVAVRANDALTAWLIARGLDASPLKGAWDKSLADSRPDVIVLDQSNLSPEQLGALRAHASGGGGLVVAGLGWGWQQVHGGRPLSEHPLNRLLAPAGLSFADGTLEATAPGNHFAAGATADATLAMLGAMAALDRLEARARVPRGKPDADTRLDDQASATVALAARFDFDPGSPLLARLERLLERHADRVNPSKGRPLRRSDGLARALMSYEVRRAEGLAPEKVTAHRSAAAFPGEVPPGAERITTDVTVDPQFTGWRSLGLYAAAGEAVTVTLPPDAPAGLRVQIGCHTDGLWHLERWDRSPDVVVSRALNPGSTTITSPFGGLVYITGEARRAGAPRPQGQRPEPLRLTVAGAVRAPLFVLGTDNDASWRAARQHPGPWAELATDKVILTVPSATVRTLENPAELMAWWDRVLDAHADLATIPRQRRRPERIVADVQISAGYMHSGYPIMTHLDAAAFMTNLPDLRTGKNAWGLFHELGHNHQEREWTFEGTGEVTVNLFTLHALEVVCGLPPGAGHDGLAKPGPMVEHFAAGAPFDRWKSDPFLALRMYFQLRQAFGWETYKRVFAEYRKLPAAERPKTDADSRDQWMVRFSLAVGRDLGPFFEKWGVPVTAEARARTAHLPVWMPEGM